MKTASENKINIFISYSWDNKAHQEWVISLADLIETHGGNVIIDRKGLKFGGHIKSFMLKSILQADVVLMILTPIYKRKADNLEGGAGYEYNIINDDLFKKINANEKYISVLRLGDLETSVTTFLQGFKYVDLREGVDYDANLKELLEQIFKTPLKQPIENKSNESVMENEYKDITLLTKEMKLKAEKYFQQVFVGDNPSITKLKVKTTIAEWEEEVKNYHSSFVEKFNPSKMEIYEDYLEDFKNNVFGKKLWTVKAALKTHDPDLARYKKDYRDADAQIIYDTINGILSASHNYVKVVVPAIEYSSLKTVEGLKLEFLNEEEMFMNKIIGFGIRSEVLHRYHPANFPIMTQKSLWAMYFICESADEFITIEQKNRQGIMRVSHNWQYPYERFTFLMNELANEFTKWVKPYGISLQLDYRFGYVNMFLSSIHELHKADIRMLHEWVVTD